MGQLLWLGKNDLKIWVVDNVVRKNFTITLRWVLVDFVV